MIFIYLILFYLIYGLFLFITGNGKKPAEKKKKDEPKNDFEENKNAENENKGKDNGEEV
jgi:hypothetical protein